MIGFVLETPYLLWVGKNMSEPMTAIEKKKLVRKELDRLSRKPFLDVLATFLDCQPNPDAIQTAADKQPDRWTQSVVMLSKLGGYTEKTEHTENINLNIYNMSDVQLQTRLTEVMEKLAMDGKAFAKVKSKPGQPIDLKPLNNENVYAIDSDHAMKDKTVPGVQGLPDQHQDDPP